MPKEYSRTERIGDLMQRELSHVLARESHDPRFNLLTVSAVKVTRDLAQAKVYVTSYTASDKQASADTIKALNKAAGFFRSLLAKQIQLRTIPQLRFIYDESIEYGSRLSTLIDEVNKREEE